MDSSDFRRALPGNNRGSCRAAWKFWSKCMRFKHKCDVSVALDQQCELCCLLRLLRITTSTPEFVLGHDIFVGSSPLTFFLALGNKRSRAHMQSLRCITYCVYTRSWRLGLLVETEKELPNPVSFDFQLSFWKMSLFWTVHCCLDAVS